MYAMKRKLSPFVLASSLCLLACDAASPQEAGGHWRDTTSDASILSAYFGFDNGVNIAQNAGCDPYMGFQDGMPVVFDVEIDQDTLGPSDFEVTFRTAGGAIARVAPRCVGLPPAGDEPEDRTVLMVGQFGAGDTVLRVEVVDELHDEDENDLEDLFIDDVTPLGRGPEMVYAEVLPPSEWTLDEADSGLECPLGTTQIVQANRGSCGGVWSPSMSTYAATRPSDWRRYPEPRSGRRDNHCSLAHLILSYWAAW